MISEVTKLSDGNRVVTPAAIRKSSSLQIDDKITLVLQENGEVRLLPQHEAIRQAQGLVRQYISEERNPVDELLAERRTESEKE